MEKKRKEGRKDSVDEEKKEERHIFQVQILLILDQTLSILKKDRKIYLRPDSSIFRSNSAIIFKKIFLNNFRSNSPLFQ